MLEFKSITPDMKNSLQEFFDHLVKDGDDYWFSPHPFDDKFVDKLITYSGKDVYRVALLDNKIVGYCLLRGWDEGYENPSLGIAIDNSVRGYGISKALMFLLHSEAKLRGAKKVILKVKKNNFIAINLYISIGYEFTDSNDIYNIGYCNLTGR